MTYEEFINSLENNTEDSRPKYKKPQNYQPTHLNIHPTEYKTEETSNPDPSLLWETIREENCSFLWDGKEYHAVQDTLSILIYLKGDLIAQIGRWDEDAVSKLENAFYPCEECGGIGHTIGFLGALKVVYPCSHGCWK